MRYKFQHTVTDIFFDSSFQQLNKLTDRSSAVLITDEHIYSAHPAKFKGWNVIVLKPGEEFKIQPTVDAVIEKLIQMGADRATTIVGVGGGVITDLSGYIASVYMRGLRFGFIPTTILGMVDASIGGKNGVDVGVYKNLAGTIRQPGFIIYDSTILKTLPLAEWENGFAEIIKHACIKDAKMFSRLEKTELTSYQADKQLLNRMIRENASIKLSIVKKDEWEKSDRKLLNFGHTLGHALENQYELSHGQAISIGMCFACHVSEQLTGFRDTERVAELLKRYGLPAFASFNKEKVWEVLRMDKKRTRKEISFVMLTRIGNATVKTIPLNKLERIFNKF